MQNVKDASVDWIRSHIDELWPGEQQPVEIAEALAAIASAENVPVEQVIEWLHEQRDDGHELSSTGFSRAFDADTF